VQRYQLAEVLAVWRSEFAAVQIPGSRWRILLDNNFDPRTDISRDWQGVYQLTGNKPRLRDQIRAYFRDRNEDSPELSAQESYIV
jgi:hypothetical protein